MLKRLLCLLVLAAMPARADPVRGLYLARAADCQACHTMPGGPAYAGGLPLKTVFGEIVATNITPDPVHGIGAYSQKDFDRAVRHGVAKDGHHLYPAMPYPSFARMSDADLADLYDYFRHGVAPVAVSPPKTQLPFPFNLRWFLVFWNWLFAPHTPFQVRQEHDAQWNRGAYLVETLGHCGACHTARGLAFEEHGLTPASSYYLSGGTLDDWRAPSLRGDPRTGLGAWSEGDIAEFLKTGRAHGGMAFGSMSQVVTDSTQYMSDVDRAAIAHYLKALPMERQPYVAPSYATQARQEWPGAGLYAQACQSCHGTNGQGTDHAPRLAGNPAVQSADPASVIHILLKGGRAPDVAGVRPAAMPGFEPNLNDREIAEVATYVRQGWGNRAPAVGETKVRDERHFLRHEAYLTLPPPHAVQSPGKPGSPSR
jgi:mono/diheme cytochrome c family protein